MADDPAKEPTARRYAPRTIMFAQRRVLRLVRSYLTRMAEIERRTLRTNGAGLATIDELLEHIEAAINLKVRASNG